LWHATGSFVIDAELNRDRLRVTRIEPVALCARVSKSEREPGARPEVLVQDDAGA
jgi:hypothetical protein